MIRIGTRAPVTCPQRVTAELAKLLRSFAPLFIVTHFNHPRELTAEALAPSSVWSTPGSQSRTSRCSCARSIPSARLPARPQSSAATSARAALLPAPVRCRRGRLEQFRTPLAKGIEILGHSLRGHHQRSGHSSLRGRSARWGRQGDDCNPTIWRRKPTIASGPFGTFAATSTAIQSRPSATATAPTKAATSSASLSRRRLAGPARSRAWPRIDRTSCRWH